MLFIYFRLVQLTHAYSVKKNRAPYLKADWLFKQLGGASITTACFFALYDLSHLFFHLLPLKCEYINCISTTL